MDGIVFQSLLVEDNLALTTLFSLQELDGAIIVCEGNKSLGQMVSLSNSL